MTLYVVKAIRASVSNCGSLEGPGASPTRRKRIGSIVRPGEVTKEERRRYPHRPASPKRSGRR